MLRDSGRHACSCQALSHGVRDVCRPLTPPSPPATAMLGDRPLLPTVTVDPRGEPPHACMLTEQKQSDTLEVFDPADVQHIFCISFPSSLRVRQAVVTSTEVTWSLLLLTGLGGTLRRWGEHLGVWGHCGEGDTRATFSPLTSPCGSAEEGQVYNLQLTLSLTPVSSL